MASGYSACDLEATGRDCLRQKEADRLFHQTYPTRQSGEVTDCSGPSDNVSRTQIGRAHV